MRVVIGANLYEKDYCKNKDTAIPDADALAYD